MSEPSKISDQASFDNEKNKQQRLELIEIESKLGLVSARQKAITQ
jgi:hypothetical protein